MNKPSSKKARFLEYVLYDVLGSIDGITHRSMFGGYGIYKNGVVFALIAFNKLFFRVDDTSRKEYEKKESAPFTYTMKGKKQIMNSYWELPVDILEDRQKIKRWAQKAYCASKNRKQ